MSNQNAVQLQNITKTYQMGEVPVHALRGVDLELLAGELAALLGPLLVGEAPLNGAGWVGALLLFAPHWLF